MNRHYYAKNERPPPSLQWRPTVYLAGPRRRSWIEVLDALKAADVNDRIRQVAQTIYQPLIEAELTAVIGPGHTSAPRPGWPSAPARLVASTSPMAAKLPGYGQIAAWSRWVVIAPSGSWARRIQRASRAM